MMTLRFRPLPALLLLLAVAGCTTGPVTLANPVSNPAIGPDSRPVESRTPYAVMGTTGFGRPTVAGQGAPVPVTGSNAMPQSRNSLPH